MLVVSEEDLILKASNKHHLKSIILMNGYPVNFNHNAIYSNGKGHAYGNIDSGGLGNGLGSGYGTGDGHGLENNKIKAI